MANKNINDDARMLEIDERVEKYLRGEMNSHEEEIFMADMKTDSELADRAKTMAVLIKGIREVGRKSDEAVINKVKMQALEYEERAAEMSYDESKEEKVYASIMRDSDESCKDESTRMKVEKIRPKSKLISLSVRVVAIAAMLLLLVGIGDFFIARQRTIGLANEYMAYAPQMQIDEGALKGGELDDKVMAELMPIFNEVNKGENLQDNIELLSALFDQASSPQVNKYTDFADYIGYNLAIAHLKNNEKKEALKVLNDLLEIYPDYQIARELMDKIDGMISLW